MNKHFIFGCILVFSSVLFFSCNKINPEPTYAVSVKIDSYDLIVSADGTQGTASHKIENVWAYLDKKFIGVFPLPANIPVIAEGSHLLELSPGIKMNGISATRVDYPFYQQNSYTLNFNKDSVFKLKPVTSYFPFTKFDWLESFESNGIALEKTIGSMVDIKLTQDASEVFEGAKSAYFKLSGNDTTCEFDSKNAYILPHAGQAVYFELNYKINHTLNMGILANQASGAVYKQQIITLNPSYDESGYLVWKKIYIEMAPELGNNSDASNYSIFFSATRKHTDADAVFFIDNLKLVH